MRRLRGLLTAIQSWGTQCRTLNQVRPSVQAAFEPIIDFLVTSHSTKINMNGHQKSWLVRMLLELRCYSDLSRHIKEPHNYLNIIWKLRVCFIPKQPALSCLLMSCQFPLCSAVYFLLRENMMCVAWECLACPDSATVTKVGGCLRRVNYGWTYTCYVVLENSNSNMTWTLTFRTNISEYSQIQQMYYMKNVIFNNIIR